MPNVIHFDNAKNTEMPSSDRNYVLALEEENLEYKMLVAELTRQKGPLRPWRRALIVACVAAAFVLGWTVDPPLKLWPTTTAQAATMHGAELVRELRPVRRMGI